MSGKNIVERIISDAENEASSIISAAERSAEEVIRIANERAERNLAGTKAEVEHRTKAILDGKAATARLDCAKIELGEKRRAIDAVYDKALQTLIKLDKKQSVALAERLLNEYAEIGDEIVFAANYAYAEDVAKLGVVKERKLTLSHKGEKIDGGFVLRGKTADKDLSYGALLAADREQNVTAVAEKIFVKG
ncbi:MAG: hypothetical protein K2L42_01075 [Clostridia bacterium]|nr:hypothetical protein [Clostridia bacterium]